MQITSKDNSKLKLARKILAGQEDEYILLEGTRLVEEALRSDVEVVDALYTPRFAVGERGAEVLAGITEKIGEDSSADASTMVSEVVEDVFATVTDTKTSQGIILICKRPSTAVQDFKRHTAGDGHLFVLLHEVNNPSNLGAILRTAEAAGVDGVITTKSSADAFSVKSLRAGMGSNLRLPLWTGASFDDVIAWARSRGLTTTAADAHTSLSYREVDWKQPRLVVFGSEAHGLSSGELSMIDEKITIPMANDVESLNLAVSAGIILFQAKQ